MSSNLDDLGDQVAEFFLGAVLGVTLAFCMVLQLLIDAIYGDRH